MPTSTGVLRRGAAAYSDFCGRLPSGYRAPTYRLTTALFATIVDVGFAWDSSLMTAMAQGRNTHPEFRSGDYFILGDRFVEFPMGRWRGLPIAFNHAYRLLLKVPLEAALRTAFGPRRFVAYNVHMTDLVRCESLRDAQRSPLSRLLHRYMWSMHGGDTFASLRSIVKYLARRGYGFEATDDLCRRVTG